MSVSDEQMKLQLEFLNTTAHSIDLGPNAAQIGVVSYSGANELSIRLDEYHTHAEMENAIFTQVTHIKTSTKTPAGLAMATTGCFGSGARGDPIPKMAILMTDGKSYTSISRDAHDLRDVATLYAFGINQADEAQLKEIVGHDHKKYRMVSSFDVLQPEVTFILDLACGKFAYRWCTHFKLYPFNLLTTGPNYIRFYFFLAHLTPTFEHVSLI